MCNLFILCTKQSSSFPLVPTPMIYHTLCKMNKNNLIYASTYMSNSQKEGQLGCLSKQTVPIPSCRCGNRTWELLKKGAVKALNVPLLKCLKRFSKSHDVIGLCRRYCYIINVYSYLG